MLIADGADEEHGLNKTLTAVDLVALGIGAIVGAGIFSTLGSASSGGGTAAPAGPGVTFQFWRLRWHTVFAHSEIFDVMKGRLCYAEPSL